MACFNVFSLHMLFLGLLLGWVSWAPRAAAGQPIKVVGFAVCDACRENRLSNFSLPIPGATITLACKSTEQTSTSTYFTRRAFTNKYGVFSFDMPFSEQRLLRMCNVELTNSSFEACITKTKYSSKPLSPVLSFKSKDQSYIAYSSGWLSYQPNNVPSFCSLTKLVHNGVQSSKNKTLLPQDLSLPSFFPPLPGFSPPPFPFNFFPPYIPIPGPSPFPDVPPYIPGFPPFPNPFPFPFSFPFPFIFPFPHPYTFTPPTLPIPLNTFPPFPVVQFPPLPPNLPPLVPMLQFPPLPPNPFSPVPKLTFPPLPPNPFSPSTPIIPFNPSPPSVNLPPLFPSPPNLQVPPLPPNPISLVPKLPIPPLQPNPFSPSTPIIPFNPSVPSFNLPPLFPSPPNLEVPPLPPNPFFPTTPPNSFSSSLPPFGFPPLPNFTNPPPHEAPLLPPVPFPPIHPTPLQATSTMLKGHP